MHNNLISIIVPIYNSEKYLDRCIESILNQTYKNIEVLLVIDGSKDGSEVICENYKKLDSRIKIIKQKNKGVSEARNNGIRNANGEYIQFVDSDDYLEINCCEKLIENIKFTNSDLVICGYKNQYKDKDFNRRTFYPKELTFYKEDFQEYFFELYERILINSPFNKLYKKNILKLLFPKEISLGEDLIFNLRYLQDCNKISVTSDCLYNYWRNTEESLSTKYREDFYEMLLLLNDEIISFCNRMSMKLNKDNYRSIGKIYINNLIGIIETTAFNKSYLESRYDIKKLINNDSTKQYIDYTDLNFLQNRILKILIKKNLVEIIYIFFNIKKYIKLFIRNKKLSTFE